MKRESGRPESLSKERIEVRSEERTLPLTQFKQKKNLSLTNFENVFDLVRLGEKECRGRLIHLHSSSLSV
jgi:hypothetical protein